MSISVGDFAEQLIAQENLSKVGGNSPPTFEQDPSFYSADVTHQAPDISEVVVPNDFITGIVEDKEIIAETPNLAKAVQETPPPTAPITEVAELKSLVEELKGLIMEVKQTLTEMTTVGAGIGAPAPPKDEEDDLKKILRRLKTKRGTSK